MALGPNNTLITSANRIDIEANGISGETHLGTAGADAFVIANGTVGDDAIVGFSNNDTIITYKKIFDGNNDGYIDFGPNSVLDVDRFGSGDARAGEDQISVAGAGNERVLTVRYLGTKEGAFAYGAANVRDGLLGHFDRGFVDSNGTTGGDISTAAYTNKIDNDVGTNNFSALFTSGSTVLLTDNATGLNFGGDTITGFGADDLLVFTSKLYDSDNSGIVTFGGNKVLDLSGSTGPSSSDPAGGPGGQLDAGAARATSGVTYLGEKNIDGVNYYYYGTANTTFNAAAVGVVNYDLTA
ncbi:MAG: hypothetical protein PGN09_06580 [Sphingomonas fennica]